MERRGHGRRSKEVETIALERMEILFAEAERAVREGKGPRAKRYVALARRIGMRYNVSVPARHRRWVCNGCGAFLLPGRNASARLRPQRIVIHCGECGAVKRVGRGKGKTRGRAARR
jgi:ribonuclease P protein subunit RPR2